MILKALIIGLSALLIGAASFTPEILQVELKIAQIEVLHKAQAQKRLSISEITESIQPLNRQVYKFEEINLYSLCRLQSLKAEAFVFQTSSDIYFAINFQESNIVSIYDSECKLLSNLHNIQVAQILTDRGLVQNGIVYFISKDNSLFHFYEGSQFRNALKLASLNSQIIKGGIVRYRSKDRAEIFIAYQDGTVEVYDESGNSKMRLLFQESLSDMSLMADHHPYPLIVTKSSWIQMLDTSKYIQVSQNCPHIPNIKYILPESSYAQTVYVINHQKVYVLNFQASKKVCTIKKQYDLNEVITNVTKGSFYSNAIFLDNKVFNLTDKKLFYRTECECSAYSSLQFISKKNNHDKDFCLKRCCDKQNCTIEFMSAKRAYKDKNIFVWLTISFILVIIISLSLMNKSKVSNLDLDQNLEHEKQFNQRRINDVSRKNKQKKK